MVRSGLIWLLSGALFAGTVLDDPYEGPCEGLGDLDLDGWVDELDFAAFAGWMAGPAMEPMGTDPEEWARADFDADEDVDLADLATFSPSFGASYFVYGPEREDFEAEMLAMQVSGQLRAPDYHYERVRRDLAEIREAYPDCACYDDPDYHPRVLVVFFSEGLPKDGFEALCEYYIRTGYDPASYGGDWGVTWFCGHLNMEVLAQEFLSLPEIWDAWPNWIINMDDYITITPQGDVGNTWRYEMDDGWHDCFDGCDCHKWWVFDVNEAGTVTFISYQEFGAPWCEF